MAEPTINPNDRCAYTGQEVPSFCYHNNKKLQELEDKYKELENDIKAIETKYDNQFKVLERVENEHYLELQQQITEMDKNNSVLAERNTAALESLTSMMHEVATSYKELNRSVNGLRGNVDTMQKQLSDVDEKVSSVDHKVASFEEHASNQIHEMEKQLVEVDNKGKMDVVEMLREQTKSKISPYLVGGGIVGAIIAVFEILGKFLGS